MSDLETTPNICPVEAAGGLDNRFRKILQDPQKILKPYLRDGMQILDLGCGPGFFTVGEHSHYCCRCARRYANQSP